MIAFKQLNQFDNEILDEALEHLYQTYFDQLEDLERGDITKEELARPEEELREYLLQIVELRDNFDASYNNAIIVVD